MRLEKFKNFSTVNESVQAAKSLLLKLASDSKRRKMKLSPEEKIQFTPDEEKNILNDPKYIEVRDYCLNIIKKPGLVYPYTYFTLVEGLSMDRLNELNDKINDVSPMLQTFPLPMGNIDAYVKYKIANPDERRPAYEILGDDIDVILSQKIVKEFVDKFVGPVRREYAKSLKEKNTNQERSELLDRLYHAVHDIKNNLKPYTNQETGKLEIAEEQLVKNGSKYKDTGAYPEFIDTYVAFKSFIEDCEDKVEGWGTTDDMFITELESIAPSIKILYYNSKSKIVVTSSRSYQGIRSLCKIANASYCIKNQSTFWSYTSGKLQISISMLRLPKSDEKYLTSLTIAPNKKITSSANRSNRSVAPDGTDYIKVLKDYGIYDEIYVKAIEDAFSSELTIKNILEKIERGSGNKRDMMLSLGGLELKKSISAGLFSEQEMALYKNLIISIIKKDHNITYSDIIDAFSDPANGGFFTMADVELFNELTGGSYKKEDIIKIWNLTLDAINHLPSYLEQGDHTESSRNLIEEILRIHPSIKEYVEKNMLQ